MLINAALPQDRWTFWVVARPRWAGPAYRYHIEGTTWTNDPSKAQTFRTPETADAYCEEWFGPFTRWFWGMRHHGVLVLNRNYPSGMTWEEWANRVPDWND